MRFLRSHQHRASGHFFSDALRRRCARDVARCDARVPSASVSHSTPWSSGSLAASLAHLSATSFPGIPLWAGHLCRGGVCRGVCRRCLWRKVFVVGVWECVGRMKKKHDNGHDAARASKFFTTLVYQLATARSGLAASVRRAICDHPDISCSASA